MMVFFFFLHVYIGEQKEKKGMGELHFMRCDLHLIELSIENKKKWTLFFFFFLTYRKNGHLKLKGWLSSLN
jgi:hypothetical protein